MDIDSGNPKQVWNTVSELAIGLITLLWMQYGHNDKLMAEILEGII